jgi:hypothetical protein
MSEFSLKALAREVWDEIGGADYHVLAKEIARRVRPEDRVAALNESMLEYARHFAVGLRPSGRKTRPGAGQRNSARSAKVAGIRRSWPQLRARILTNDGQKPLSDCTAADLIFHVDLLERQARQNQAKAGWYREIAAALKAHKVQRVRDLPDAVIAEFLGERAA